MLLSMNLVRAKGQGTSLACERHGFDSHQDPIFSVNHIVLERRKHIYYNNNCEN